MKMMKGILLVGAILAFTLVTGCSKKAEQSDQTKAAPAERAVVLRIGGIQSAEDASSQGMELFAKLAAEKSGGTLEIRTFPASQLGNALSQIEAVSLGSQDMFLDASGFLAQFVPDKNVETLFFTFRDEDHFRKYLNSDINAGMEEEFLKVQGIRTVSNNWIRAPRVMASKREIRDTGSFTGLKMRVPEIRGYLESVAGIGANPTQIAWGEVYLALTQGVVDACEGPKDTMYTMKFYEVTKRIIVTDHIFDNLVMLINENIYSQLSENQKNALNSAAKEAGDWYTDTVKERVKGFYDIMAQEGTEIYEIDTTQIQAKMVEVAKKLEQSGLFSEGLYDKIQALK